MGSSAPDDWSDGRRIALEVATLCSCFASIFGCLMIMTSYVFFADLRTTARKMLLYLSFCDLVTASGNAIGVILKRSDIFCTGKLINISFQNILPILILKMSKLVQSSFTTTSSLASFFWTSSIAVFLFLSVDSKRDPAATSSPSDFSGRSDDDTYSSIDNYYYASERAEEEAAKRSINANAKPWQPTAGWFDCSPLDGKQLFPYHVVCWGLPAVILAISLGFGALGANSYSRDVGWCWLSESADQILWGLFAGKGTLRNCDEITNAKINFLQIGWETMSYIVTFLFYILTKRKLHKIMPEDKQSLINSRTRNVFTQADNKLLLVPILFVVVRISGTVRYFLDIGGVKLPDTVNYAMSLIQVCCCDLSFLFLSLIHTCST